VTVEYHGVVPADSHLTLEPSTLAQTAVHLPFRRERVLPAGSVSTIERALRPSSSKLLAPLPASPSVGTGDDWPAERRIIYDFVLSYKFALKEAAEVSFRCKALSQALYESPLEAQLIMIFNSETKAPMGKAADYYEEWTKLPAGSYDVMVQLRHDDVPFLEGFKDLLGMLHLKLATPAPISAFPRHAAAVGDPLDGGKLSPSFYEAGSRPTFWIKPPEMPENAEAGDVLTGTVHYGAKGGAGGGVGQRPKGYPLSVVVPPAVIKPKEDEEEKEEEDELSEEKLAEALRDLGCAQLKKLSAKVRECSSAEERCDPHVAIFPCHVTVL